MAGNIRTKKTNPPLDAGSVTPTPTMPVVPVVESSPARKVDLVTLYYPNTESIWYGDELSLHRELKKAQAPEAFILLHSSGGIPHVAFKMIKQIRNAYEKVTVVVPQFAKSAATLVCLGCDMVVMGPASELGPLDMQLENHNRPDSMTSALDVRGSFRVLATMALDRLPEAYDTLRSMGIRRSEAVHQAREFASAFVTPVLQKIDPYFVSQSFRALDVSQRYGKELLEQYMFPIKSAGRDNMIDDIMYLLIWALPDHGYAILRDGYARFLKLTKAENFPEWERIWVIFERLALQDSQQKIIKVENEFLPHVT